MATENTFTSTPLDDIKDLAWLTHERIGVALDSLSGRGVEIYDETEGWAFDELDRAALETLAKYVPGMHIAENGLATYETEEAHKLAHTYDDGTPLVEYLSFPDLKGYSFTYRPRYNGPRDKFIEEARQQAEAYAADIDARVVEVAGFYELERIYVEYHGGNRGDFGIGTFDGDEGRTIVLSKAQLGELRDGIDRLLGYQQKEVERFEAERKLGELMEKTGAEMQARIPEILEAITAGTATEEQLGCVVALPGGLLKTWEHVTPDELEALRRAHSF